MLFLLVYVLILGGTLIACDGSPIERGPLVASGAGALTAADFVMLSRNGIDAQTFSTYNGPPVDNTIGLWDSHFTSSSVNPNVYRIVVSVGSDGLIDVVRPYGVSGSVTIPSGGYVVTASSSMLPWLAGLAVDDPLIIKATTACTPRADAWGAIPALVYHSITDTTAFEAHLQAIDEAGYTTMTLEDVGYYLDGGLDDCFHTMPTKPIVLTFDDGYSNQFPAVPELLNTYDMVGTFFIITSFPGVQSWVAPWADIEDAAATYPANVELGCHSHAAHYQTTIGGKLVAAYMQSGFDVAGDMATCRDTLYDHTGIDPTALAWPFGSYDDSLTDIARDAGFTTMWNTWPGVNVSENDDASANVRRFGGSVTASWASIETTMDRWYVCR